MTKYLTKVLPADLTNGANQQGIQFFYLDGSQICGKETFLIKVAEAMKFPDYFGFNWDALDECITDLGWCPANRYVLIYDQPEVFSKADPTQWKIANDVLQSAIDYWRNTETPLDILFIEK
jgi:Barstar (barnase inhibitor)